MKRYFYILLSTLLFVACTTEPLPTSEPQIEQPAVEEVVAGELLVKFDSYVADIIEQHVATTRAAGGDATRSGVLSVDQVLNIVDAYELERVFPRDMRHEERTRKEGLHQWYVVRFGDRFTIEEVAERLSQLGEVESVERNRTIKRAYDASKRAVPLTAEKLAMMVRTRSNEYQFDDELLPLQWNLINRGDMFNEKSREGADVQVEQAWRLSTGDESIVVAVLDEGVCVNHPDLAANMWHNSDEQYLSHEDNDDNGYAGDYYGYNFVQNSGIITTDNVYDSGHGSHVAGVIAACNNNGVGVSSIAGGYGDIPGVKIMSCQIFSGNMASSTLAQIRAIKYAADNGAVILQCSWGYVSGAANAYDWGVGFANEDEWAMTNPLEKSALEYFSHNAGSPNGVLEGGIAIFAAGNEYAPAAGYPGAYEDYVSVAATAADFTPAVYTNYGPGTTISAPGGDQDYYYEYGEKGKLGEPGLILSTLPYNVSKTGYGYMEGTSMACPHVSGVVALGLSYATKLRRHFTVSELRELLYSTVTPFDEYLTGKKTYYHWVADLELNHCSSMNLGDYRGNMGSGQVNAIKFLEAIADGGIPMSMPNVYIAPDDESRIDVSRYFVDGERLTYTLSVENKAVAEGVLEGSVAVLCGVTEGTTKASVTASNGQTQTFVITVREGAASNGWL